MNSSDDTIDQERIILTDCDGVLLNWRRWFYKWMDARGYKMVDEDAHFTYQQYDFKRSDFLKIQKQFNECAWIRWCPTIRDSMSVVQRLHRKGWRFHVITAMTLDEPAQTLREQNLLDIFGTAIEEVHFADLGGSKKHILERYQGTGYLWVEDSPRHIETGSELGLTPVLMNHYYNEDYRNEHKFDDIIFVNNWSEIEKYVEGEKYNGT